ncbi:MAG: twin-arginine translocation signal domain-containing protein [Gammaproteobacteria bacterium]
MVDSREHVMAETDAPAETASGITRRDFLQCALAAGAALVGGACAMNTFDPNRGFFDLTQRRSRQLV